MFTDPTGMEQDGIIIKGKNESYTYNENSSYEGKDKFIKQTLSDINEIRQSDEGNMLIQELDYSNNDFTIEKKSENKFKPDSAPNSFANLSEIKAVTPNLKSSDGSGGTIYYNPNTKESGFNTNGNRSRPGFIGLAHELFHARDSNRGQMFIDQNFRSYIGRHEGLEKSEWRAVYFENILRGQLKIPLRTHYGTRMNESGNMEPLGPRLLDDFNLPINYNLK